MIHYCQEDYANASPALWFEIDDLLNRVWPPAEPPRTLTLTPVHRLDLRPHSFFARVDGRLLAYAAILHKTARHASADWRIAGLSCVCSDPAHRRLGLGAGVVSKATRWLLASDVDLGLFTCDPALVPFYVRRGWQPARDLVVVGNGTLGAIRGDAAGKVTLLRLISPRAHAHAADFCRGEFNLALPDRQFW